MYIEPSSWQKTRLVAGHGGSDEESFAAEDDSGYAHVIPVAGLVQAFKAVGQAVRCVIVNACRTERLAQALAATGPCVIGMRQPVGDRSAIRFSIGFYQALAAGKSVETAFDVAVAQLMMTPRSEDAKAPMLLRSVDGAQTPHGPQGRSVTRPTPCASRWRAGRLRRFRLFQDGLYARFYLCDGLPELVLDDLLGSAPALEAVAIALGGHLASYRHAADEDEAPLPGSANLSRPRGYSPAVSELATSRRTAKWLSTPDSPAPIVLIVTWVAPTARQFSIDARAASRSPA